MKRFAEERILGVLTDVEAEAKGRDRVPPRRPRADVVPLDGEVGGT
jgi:hypothetical protein